jgi:nucleoside-diphosphate-sugar epimerase
MMPGKILVTGASGFIGGETVRRLNASQRWKTVPGVRRAQSAGQLTIDLCRSTNLTGTLSDIDCVLHCAGLAHRKVDGAAHFEINHLGTRRLAEAAAQAGVRRFVFVSSIAVHGSFSRPEMLLASSPYLPGSDYAEAKMRAEQDLFEIAQKSDMEVVVIRPPLVYGYRSAGNFSVLRRWIQRGLPLPLGDIRNRRSVVGVANLVSLLEQCIDHPAAAGQALLVSDGEDISTTQLAERMIAIAGTATRLAPCPQRLLGFIGRRTHWRSAIDGLLGSLHVDISATIQQLGWQPPLTLDQGLRQALGRD